MQIQKGLKIINGLLKRDPEGTKSGFCKARNKILPELFQAINQFLVEEIQIQFFRHGFCHEFTAAARLPGNRNYRQRDGLFPGVQDLHVQTVLS